VGGKKKGRTHPLCPDNQAKLNGRNRQEAIARGTFFERCQKEEIEKKNEFRGNQVTMIPLTQHKEGGTKEERN